MVSSFYHDLLIMPSPLSSQCCLYCNCLNKSLQFSLQDFQKWCDFAFFLIQKKSDWPSCLCAKAGLDLMISCFLAQCLETTMSNWLSLILNIKPSILAYNCNGCLISPLFSRVRKKPSQNHLPPCISGLKTLVKTKIPQTFHVHGSLCT